MNTLQRVFVRLRVFFKKRMRIFTKHPKRTIFGVVLIVILAVMSILMFATPLFFNATVRFETGEGSVIFDKTIRRGTALPNIENPTYEYNTFGGWYFDKEYTKPYENQKIYSDTVLYAKWNTIFTDEFFIEKSNLINEIFNIDVFTQPLDIIIRDRDMIEEYFDDVPDDIDFMYFIEHSCFSIFACIASPETSKEMLLKLYGIVEKDVIEDGSIDSYNLIRADRAIFLIPYGLENIFFGDIEKAGDYYYTWNNERNAYTLLRYLGDDKVLHIPSEYKNKPIDYISSYAFYSSPVEEVYFSENIKELGFLLFVTSMLKKIDISKGIRRIRSGAFANSQHLETIRIGENVEEIGEAAFSACPSLREIIVDENNVNYKSIDGVLYDKEMKKLLAYPALKEGNSFSVPQGIEKLGIGSFSSNQNLQELVLPNSLKIIDSIAFYRTQNLNEIYIPDGVEEFGNEVFMNSNLEYVHMSPASQLKNVGLGLFYDCQKLKEFYIPKGVQILNNSLFAGCINLEKVTFAPGNAVSEIPQQIFYYCQSLREVNIPSTVQTIGSEAFVDCSSLKGIDIRNAFVIDDRAFAGCDSLEDVELSPTLRYIGDNAFAECSSLVDMEISRSADWIGAGIFVNTNLQKLTAPIFMDPEYAYLGYYFGDNNSLVPQSLKTFIINNTINILPQQAFEGCEHIEEIELPEGMRVIGERAFKNCVSLTDINLLEGLIEIGNEAFLNCSSIEALNIPSSLERIGDFAFSSNDNLLTINFVSNNVRSIGSYAFSYNENLQSFEFSEDLNYIGSYAFENCSALTEMHLLNYPTQIGIGIFKNCENLQSMSIPMNNTYENNTPSYLAYYFDGIDQEDFWKIPHGLESVNILDGITSLPDYAFYRGDYIQEVTLPQSVEDIGDYAFMGINAIPKAISKINMPESNIKSVGKQAFQFCPLLESLNLGEDLQEVGDYAFEGSGIKELHIPNAQNIGIGIFKGIDSLEEITVPLQGEYNQLTNSYISYYFHDGGGYLSGVGDRTPASLKTINITGSDKIADRAFWDCQNIENINLPDSVEEIGEYAFYNNINLQTISLGSELKYIRQFAFNGCGVLTVEIPSTIISIERSAFEGCLSLESVELEAQSQLESLGERAFFNCQSLTDINLPNRIYEIRQGTFQECSSLTQIELPSGLQYIRSLAFESSGLQSISIPYTVQEIEFGAFRYNDNLANIDFDYEKSRLKTIGAESFLGCVSLQSVTIPQSVLEIVDKTFNDCISLKEVYILREFNNNEPSYLTKATRLNTDEMFENCHEDLTIYVPENNAGNSNGVEMYKNWFGWQAYADIIEAMPDTWEY